MPHAVWTPPAEAELEEIAFYIGIKDGRPMTAERIVHEIRERADSLAANPELGHRAPHFPKGWLYFLHKRWMVLYQPHDIGIEVLRIVDVSRDFPRILGP